MVLICRKGQLTVCVANSGSMTRKQMPFSLANTRVLKCANCLQKTKALASLNGISRSQKTWGEW